MNQSDKTSKSCTTEPADGLSVEKLKIKDTSDAPLNPDDLIQSLKNIEKIGEEILKLSDIYDEEEFDLYPNTQAIAKSRAYRSKSKRNQFDNLKNSIKEILKTDLTTDEGFSVNENTKLLFTVRFAETIGKFRIYVNGAINPFRDEWEKELKKEHKKEMKKLSDEEKQKLLDEEMQKLSDDGKQKLSYKEKQKLLKDKMDKLLKEKMRKLSDKIEFFKTVIHWCHHDSALDFNVFTKWKEHCGCYQEVYDMLKNVYDQLHLSNARFKEDLAKIKIPYLTQQDSDSNNENFNPFHYEMDFLEVSKRLQKPNSDDYDTHRYEHNEGQHTFSIAVVFLLLRLGVLAPFMVDIMQIMKKAIDSLFKNGKLIQKPKRPLPPKPKNSNGKRKIDAESQTETDDVGDWTSAEPKRYKGTRCGHCNGRGYVVTGGEDTRENRSRRLNKDV